MGCKYCDESGENLCHNPWWRIGITQSHLSVVFEDSIIASYSSIMPKINYCPMCGRKLEEKNNE